jgi:hypothetical protein
MTQKHLPKAKETRKQNLAAWLVLIHMVLALRNGTDQNGVNINDPCTTLLSHEYT